jgi:PAS domain S-box-containing protein
MIGLNGELADPGASELALARAALQMSRTGWWVFDTRTETFAHSPELLGLLGVAGGQLTTESTFAAIHPDDVERVREMIAAAVAQRATFSTTYRVVAEDGEVRWNATEGDWIAPEDGSTEPWLLFGITRDVTATEATRAALLASESRFRSIAEQSPVGMFLVGRDGVSYWVNERWTEITGYTGEETHGRMRFAIHPDDRPRVEAAWARTLAAGEPLDEDLRYRRKDGPYIWIHMTARALFDDNGQVVGCAGTAQDITDRVHAAEDLRQVASRLDDALRAGGEIAWEWDAPGDRFIVSAGWHAMLGYGTGQEPATLQEWRAYVHPDDWPGLMERLGDAPDQVEATFRLRRADGAYRSFSGRAQVLDWVGEGRPRRVVGVIRDVTERLAFEAQLRETQRMEAMGLLAGSVAHDFNNLLTALRGILEIVQLYPEVGSGAAADDIREALKVCERGQGLTRQLLSFSRRKAQSPQVIRADDLLHEAAPILRRLARPEQAFEVHAGAGEASIRVDRGEVELALLNLVANARDAMPGPGTIRVTSELVRLDVAVAGAVRPGLSPGAFVAYRVADEGTGMTPDVVARLWEPFFTTKGADRGTGLGLPTVKSIVEQAGGAVTVETRPGSGSTFSLLLPVVEGAAAGQAARGTEPAHEPVLSGLRVLVVDDDAAVLAVSTRALQRFGATVEGVGSAAAALAVLEAGGAFDVMVTDHAMPGTTGSDLVERVARLWPAMPALLVSGYTAEDRIRQELQRSSAAGLLQKPFTLQELVAAVARIVGRDAGGL